MDGAKKAAKLAPFLAGTPTSEFYEVAFEGVDISSPWCSAGRDQAHPVQHLRFYPEDGNLRQSCPCHR